MKKILMDIGNVLLMILKALAWLALNTLGLLLEAAKIILLLFGMVLRIFCVFVRAGTP